MHFRSLAAISVFSVALLASGAASATPTLTIDGITIPTGISASGLLKTTENSYENLITAPGQNFQGVASVLSIGVNGGGPTWAYGQNGVFLSAVFTGFTSDFVGVPGMSPTITFTGGGTLTYYVSNTDPFANFPLSGCGTVAQCQAAEIAAVTSSTVFLQLTAVPIDAAGHTLLITIPSLAGNTLGSFISASASAFLSVTGGDAAQYFNTDTFADIFAPGGTADVDFIGGANSTAAGPFQVSGSNNAYANAIPEPVSISLFGGGLAAMGAFVRRRKAKKA